MRMSRSLAQGRGNMGVLDKTKNIKCTLGGKKGKEKTDEGSSVLLYFMTEERCRSPRVGLLVQFLLGVGLLQIIVVLLVALVYTHRFRRGE